VSVTRRFKDHPLTFNPHEVMRQIVTILGAKVPVLTEFSPLFYGPDKSRSFTQLLRTNHSGCYVFGKDSVSEKLPTAQIPGDVGQVDLLLIA